MSSFHPENKAREQSGPKFYLLSPRSLTSWSQRRSRILSRVPTFIPNNFDLRPELRARHWNPTDHASFLPLEDFGDRERLARCQLGLIGEKKPRADFRLPLEVEASLSLFPRRRRRKRERGYRNPFLSSLSSRWCFFFNPENVPRRRTTRAAE